MQRCALLCLLLFTLSLPSVVWGQASKEDLEALTLKLADDTKLLDGLRRRRMFAVAEFFCQDELGRSDIDATREASIVIEWMKTKTAKSVFLPPSERKQTWQAIVDLSSGFVESKPDHPRKFLIEVQQALSHISHSQLIRQEMDADMATTDARADALTEIEMARSLLNRLQRQISKAIPEQLRKSLTDQDLSSEQLMNLNNNVQYQLVICNLNRAQLYEQSDRLNRIDALNSVVQRLTEVQRTTSEGLPLWWKSKLSQIECLRLLGNPKSAQQLSVSLPGNDASAEVKMQLLEQKIRVAIDLGDELFSRDLLAEFESFDERSPQLELAALDLVADQAVRAQTDQRKQEWMAFAVKQAQSIEQDFGGYWGRRADLILIGTTGQPNGLANNGGDKITTVPKLDPTKLDPIQPNAGTGQANVELDLLIRLADDANRKKRFDDALKAYERASKLAQAMGDMEQALRSDLSAALILEQQKKHELAGLKLIESANRDPSLALASSTHLRGCWNLAQTIQRDPKRRTEYEELLKSHLERWREAPSADQARVYLGKLYQSGKKWELALQTYLQVGPESPLMESAVNQSEASAREILDGLRRSGKSTQAKAAQIRNWLENVRDKLPDADPVAIKLELVLIELDLIYGTSLPNPTYSNPMAAISKAGNQTSADVAKALHAISVCVSNPDAASQLVSELAGNEKELGRCDRCLTAVERYSGLTNEMEKVLSLRLEVVESAMSLPSMADPRNANRQTSWMLRKSQVLAGLGRHEEALVVLTELERQFPRNAGVQMQLARAMTIEFGSSPKVINKWRVVADRLKPYSTNWFEAKYEVARLVLASGDAERATKLLKHVQLNPPGWDGSSWKPKLEALLLKAESRK